ncbi:MAG: acyl-CoA thioesterase domain-containing protein [Ilumatobacteraceae bacterium]
MVTYADLAPLFSVESVGPSSFRPANGVPEDEGRLLGGLVLGLALRAASQTVPAERTVHSLHAYFLRAGRSTQPLTLEVAAVRDGRSFSVRRIDAVQDGTAIATVNASYVAPGARSDGPELDWQLASTAIGDPDAFDLPDPIVAGSVLLAGFEVRDAVPPGHERNSPIHPYWARARQPLPDDPAVHASVIALMSDCGVSATSCGPGIRIRSRLASASLDHAVWFHRPVRTDEWMLVSGRSQTDVSWRGFGHATVQDRRGRLVASIAQEVLRVV